MEFWSVKVVFLALNGCNVVMFAARYARGTSSRGYTDP